METSTGSELKTRLVNELAAARAELDASDDVDRSTAVHRARRALKRARSLYRVLEPIAGRDRDGRLGPVKQAFKLLSVARDADAMLATVERLRQRAKGGSAEVLGAVVASFAGLARRAHEAELPIGRIADLLRAAERKAAQLPVDFDAEALVSDELASAYKHGRTAFRVVEADANPDAWHAWRKAVKHRLHLTALRTPSAGPRHMLADLDALAEMLGECNDLANLTHAVERDPSIAGDGKAARRVIAVFSKRQRRLRKRALALGEALYCQRSRLFAHGLTAATSGGDHAAA